MKPRPQLIPAAVLAVALAAAIGAAHADSVPRGAPVEPAARFCADQDARLAAHLAYAEAKLNLTPAQKEDYRRLSDALKAAHEPLRALCTNDKPALPTALPARLDWQLKQAEAHVESLKRAAPALTRFYQTLTPAQQAIADQVLSIHGGHGGPGHHRGPGRPGDTAQPQPGDDER